MCRRGSEDGFSLVDAMLTVCVIGIVAGIALPMASGSIATQRFRGDGQSVANLVGLAKLRAAAQFTRARVRADLTTNSYSMEVWDKATESWIADGGVQRASTSVSFGFGGLDEPPPNTQAVIGLSPPCTDGVDAAADDIADTACITFNSRGIPVDSTGAPAGGHAVYLTDGNTGVYAITVTATPLIRLWWSPAHSPNWLELQ